MAVIEEVIAEIEKARWHHNEILKEGYQSGNEVLINADKVYLIKVFSKGNIKQEVLKVIDHLKSLKLIAT